MLYVDKCEDEHSYHKLFSFVCRTGPTYISGTVDVAMYLDTKYTDFDSLKSMFVESIAEELKVDESQVSHSILNACQGDNFVFCLAYPYRRLENGVS